MTAILTLALGIGANTAIFSVLNAWLLRPLPVPEPQQIMVLASQHKESSGSATSYPDFLDLKNQASAFSGLFAYTLGVGGLSFDGRAHEFAYSAVTANYFSVLGIKPERGRLFLSGEGEKPGSEISVVLGYSYWQKAFAANPTIIGKQVLVNGRTATVIGVASEGFRGTLFGFDMDGYLPLVAATGGQPSDNFWTDRGDRRLTVMGRLNPSFSRVQAQSMVNVITARLALQYPREDKDLAVRVIPETSARPAPFVASYVPIIAALFLFLAVLVLLLACMNVANLLLVRATGRQHEMVVRSALGAGRGRLARQILTETLLLAILGGLAGAVLGKWVIAASGSFLHSVTTTANFSYQLRATLDWRVLSYLLAVVVLTGLFAGVWPAVRTSRHDISAALHEGAGSVLGNRRLGRIRNLLVVSQLAGSLVLLVVASLFALSLRRAERMNLGFDPDHVLNVMLDPHQIAYDTPRTKAFYRELETRVRTIPGVESASLAYAVPFGYPGHSGTIFVRSHPLPPGQQPVQVSFNAVGPAYFKTMRVPLSRGRTFTDSDDEAGATVAIVNETMAREFWPREDPLGMEFSLKSASGPFVKVVGVVGDGQYFFLSQTPQPYFYVPLQQDFSSFLSLQVRSFGPTDSIATAVQTQIHTVAPDLPTIDIRTMRQIVDGLGGMFIFRLAASLATLMGILGLVLAVVGAYGVVSYSVSFRSREFGIRMALGATRADIKRLTFRQGLLLLGLSLCVGLAASFALASGMTKLLVNTSAFDPVVYLLVVGLLSGVTLLACYIPARHAARVDPMVALRYE